MYKLKNTLLELYGGQVDLRNCTVEFSDGASASMVFTPKDGNLSWSFSQDYNYIQNNGQIAARTYGEESPMSVNFNALFDDSFANGAGDVLADFIDGAELTSTDTDNPCGPFSFNITIYNGVKDDSSACKEADKMLIIPNVAVTSEDVDVKEASISFSGESIGDDNNSIPPRWQSYSE